MNIDDDILDDAASALCDWFLETFTQPMRREVWEPFRFAELDQDAQEIYRKGALDIIARVHDAVHGHG